jgi:hypothetical protein
MMMTTPTMMIVTELTLMMIVMVIAMVMAMVLVMVMATAMVMYCRGSKECSPPRLHPSWHFNNPSWHFNNPSWHLSKHECMLNPKILRQPVQAGHTALVKHTCRGSYN